jgi:hypothetical protein
VVAAEGDRAAGGDLPLDLDGGRERVGWQGPQQLVGGQLPDRAPTRATPGVAGGGKKPVQGGLGVGGRAQPGGAPPPLGEEVDRLLDHAFAVGSPRRARVHTDLVVLGDRGEGGLDAPGRGVHDGGHAVKPPAAGGAAQAAQDGVQRLDQMRQVLGLGQDRAGLAGVRQRPDQHVRGPAPRRAGQIRPVPLQLLARRVVQLGGLAAGDAGARLAAGPQPVGAQRAGEARVAAPVAQRDHLLIQRGCPHVAVLTKARGHIVEVGGEHIRRRTSALPRGALAGQIRADRLWVTAKMAGDRLDRPALLAERGCLHVFLPCQHGPGLLPGAVAHTPPASRRSPLPVADHPGHQEAQAGEFR